MRIGRKNPNSIKGKDIWMEAATITVSSSVTGLTFSGLESITAETYRITGAIYSSLNGYVNMIFNDDTGGNYHTKALRGNGTTISGDDSGSSATAIRVGYVSNSLSFIDYIITAKYGKYKSVAGVGARTITSTDINATVARVGHWRSTDVLDSISIQLSTGNIIENGTIIKLYKLQ